MGKYFTTSELSKSSTAKAKGIDNTPNGETLHNLDRLIADILDPIRAKWGKRIFVNSGYRCIALNKAVGGASNSQHILGKAADITTGSKEGNKQLFEMILSMNLCFGQLINEFDYSWIHISQDDWRNINKNRKEVLDSVKSKKNKTIYMKHK